MPASSSRKCKRSPVTTDTTHPQGDRRPGYCAAECLWGSFGWTGGHYASNAYHLVRVPLASRVTGLNVEHSPPFCFVNLIFFARTILIGYILTAHLYFEITTTLAGCTGTHPHCASCCNAGRCRALQSLRPLPTRNSLPRLCRRSYLD